jgi:hypothetical protein
MSMKDLAYDIEQLTIEGYGPASIAVQLGCDIELVHGWMRENGLIDKPKTKLVKNLMTGEFVEIAADTPWCCNPASETYWSM